MATFVYEPRLGATGKPFLTDHIQKVLAEIVNLKAIGCWKPYSEPVMTPLRPALQINGLPSVAEDASPVTPISQTVVKQSSDRDAAKVNMLRKIRPPPFKYAWSFYHDKHSTGDDYEGRLTLMLENIVTVKPFWEAYNRFPIQNLEMKDSVHFFKRGVKPVWEDRRNIKGGCWTFRVGKSNSQDFWKEVLMLAVGEQFADVIQPGELASSFSSTSTALLTQPQAMTSVVSLTLSALTPSSS